MSAASFGCRSSTSRNSQAYASGDRRRYWLRQRGLLSAQSGPSRRLASLLPRKHAQSSACSGKTPSNLQSSTHIHLEVDQNSVPVVVTKPPKTNNGGQPSIGTTASGSADDSSRIRTGAFRSRSNRRGMATDFDANAETSSQSKSKRFLSRLRRRSRDLPPLNAYARASIDVPRARDRDLDRVALHRHSLDRRRNPTSANPASRPRARAVYTVFDKDLPRHVLQGNTRYEKSSWNDYREHIDELAEDTKFMDYLTAPVQRRPPLKAEPGHTNNETQNLAVNKLYPLAFIRLLEAHAKYAAEDGEPCDPEEEEHRYDDLEREDEGRVERTVSNGLYDMGRFRTVGGTQQGTSDSRMASQEMDYNSPKLIERTDRGNSSPYHSRLFSRISRESDVSSVPVC